MGAFVFDKCCFCIELKTGCFIIGYLGLVGYSILTVISILGIVGGAALTQHNSLYEVEKDDSFGSFGKEDDSAKVAGIAIMVMSGLILLIVVFMLTFIIVLLVGLHKNKPGHLKAYIVFSCIFIVLSILGVIGSAFNAEGRSSIGQGIFNILWNIYTTLVIRSQYLAMRSPERGPAIYSAA